MGVAYNSSIVTSGLVLCLDAGNIKSYDGRENLVSYSTYNASTWSNIFPANATLTTNIDAPDGSNTAVRLTCSTSGNSLLRVTFPAFTPNGSDSYTISFYVRRISGNTTAGGELTTDLSDGSPGGNYLPNLITNQWVRISFTGVPTATTKTFIDLLSDRNNNYVLDFWGVQVEKNISVSNYTATNGTTITRTTTWTDLSGNARTGTLTNGPTYSSSNGGAIVFDGTDDYVSCGTFFNYTNFTISLWVYPGSTQVQYADIFDNNHTGTQNFVCQQNVSNTNQYSFACINATNGSGTSVFTLTANTWHYLTFTWNNSVASAYINGVFHSSGSAANPINYVNPNLSLARWSAGGRNWNGRISNFTAHSRVLSESEIQQNFNATRGRFGI